MLIEGTERLTEGVTLHLGDCVAVLATLDANSIDAIVTDPPYGLGFMGKEWDRIGDHSANFTNLDRPHSSQANFPMNKTRGRPISETDGPAQQQWHSRWAREAFRVLKPGGHLLAFGGTRTYHRLACAVEDAGFEIRDQVQWLYGSGFPKSHNVGKSIEKNNVGGKANLKQIGTRPGLNNEDGTSGFAYSQEYVPGVSIGGKQINGEIPIYEINNEWGGWGTALKPACEPIVLARKPLIGTVAENVQKHRTGGLNIDACRVGDFVNDTPPGTDRYNQANFEQGYRPDAYQSNGREGEPSAERRYTDEGSTNFAAKPGRRRQATAGKRTVANGAGWGVGQGGDSYVKGTGATYTTQGRWPANVIHDGSDEVVGAFPDSDGAQGIVAGSEPSETGQNGIYGRYRRVASEAPRGDSGSAARFFYTAKADAEDRTGSKHPTVKPVDLMAYLIRLVTPKGGTVLDPFAGTGTVGEAAFREGVRAILIEREPEYQEDIRRRMRLATTAGPDERAREAMKARMKDKPADHGPLFGGLTATGRP